MSSREELFNAETREQIEAHSRLRRENIDPKRPDPSSFAKLDGSIKKNTSFIKKIKGGINTSNIESLKKDLQTLKVEKYLEEIAVSIADGTYKTTSDLWAAVELSSLLHSKFSDFQKLLVDALMKSFSALSVGTLDGKEDQRLTKQKSTLRFLTELYLVGLVYDGPKEKDWVIPSLLASLFANDKQHLNVSLGAAFSKFYSIYFLPTELCKDLNQEQVELRNGLVPEAIRTKTHKYLTIYFKTVVNRLTKDSEKLKKMEKHLADNMIVQTNENDPIEKLQKSFEKLLSQAQILATYTFSELPVFETKEEEQKFTISVAEGKKEDADVGIWEDEDQKGFYENLLDLANQVPLILLGGKKATVVDETLDESQLINESITTGEVDVSKDDDVVVEEITESQEENTEETSQNSSNQLKLQDIFARMLNALNREAVDGLAVEFAFLNNKGSRKQLVQALLAVPRQRLELLPYYSRMIATLSQYMPDIGTSVVEELHSSFRYHQRKKNQVFVEEKLKNIRFLSELTKFRITPFSVIFKCIKSLLDDFNFHNIDLCCALLETCGRFLFSLPNTNAMMVKVLEIISRKKNIGNFDTKYNFMIDNAIYATNPPEVAITKVKKEKSTIELFIRKLVYKDLSRSNTDVVLKILRKLNWHDESTRHLLEKVFFKIWKVKYSSIHLMTVMLAELSRFYPDFGVAVVDHTLEMIRVGLETNLFKWNQKRISCIKYLGEFYNYRMVDSSIIFDTLYLLARFGHPKGLALAGTFSPFDAPNDFFRLRLICTLLDTCGTCFKKGHTAKKLDTFLVFLQLYVFSKEKMPMDVEFFYSETLDLIRPGYQLFKSFEECGMKWNEIAQQQMSAVEDPVVEDEEIDQVRAHIDDIEQEAEPEEGEIVTAGEEIPGEKEAGSEADSEPEEAEKETESVKVNEQEDDEQFEREFSRMVQESLESRKGEKKVSAFDAPIPTRRADQNTSQSGIIEEKGKVAFTLMTKKGTKQPQLKPIYVPQESTFVQDALKAKQREIEERIHLKKMVLSLEENRKDEPEAISIEKIWNVKNEIKEKRWDDDDFEL